MLWLADRLVGEAAGRAEFEQQALFAFLDRQRLLQVAQQQPDEDRVGTDVEQGALARALADRGERIAVIALAVEAHPFDLQRHRVARRDAALRGLEERQPWPVVADIAEWYGRGQRRLDRLGRSLWIPTRLRQMPWQHIALEHATLARQRHPSGAERHHQRLEFADLARCYRLRLVALLELEPVEAVRRQHDHVGHVTDRRKAR